MVSLSENADVIIIGAGIGGLAAGTFLSKKGLKVLIIEQRHYPGGYCSSFRRGGFIFDSAAHVIGSCKEGYSFWKLIENLNIKIDFIGDKEFYCRGDFNLKLPWDEINVYKLARLCKMAW